MLNTFPKAIRMMALKPAILIPGILSALISSAIFFAFYALLGDAISVLNLGSIPFPASLHEFGDFISSPSVLILIPFILFFTLVELMMNIATADYVRALKQKGSAPILNSIKYAVEKWSDALLLTILAGILGGAAFILFITLNGLIQNIGIIAVALQIILVVLSAYIAIRLMFTISSIAMDGVPVKQGLQKSWAFTKQHFWGAVVLGFILLIVSGLADGLQGILFPDITTEIELFMSSVIDLIVGVFVVVSISIFYAENKK